MPLVKKKLSVAAGATSDQVLAGTTYEYELSVLRQLIQQEQRLLTQQWTSRSTMQNLPRMRQYRLSLLERRLVGTTLGTSLTTWLQPDKCETDQ